MTALPSHPAGAFAEGKLIQAGMLQGLCNFWTVTTPLPIKASSTLLQG